MAALAKLELISSAELTEGQSPAVIPLRSEALIIGRSRKLVQIVLDLPDNTISRRHAEIVYIKGMGNVDNSYEVRDLNSTNGIFINNLRVLKKVLENGDVIQFGGAAGVPVGTEFAGNSVHIRYRFVRRVATTSSISRKRKNSGSASKVSPSTARPAQPKRWATSTPSNAVEKGPPVPALVPRAGGEALSRADTANAVATLRSLGTISPGQLSSSAVVAVNDVSMNGRGPGIDTFPTNPNGGSTKRGTPSPATNNGCIRNGVPTTATNGGVAEKFKAPIANGGSVGKDARITAPNDESFVPATAARKILGDAMCGLCSDVLLDVTVLACSHCFCRLCWINYARENDFRCPVCKRKYLSSERGRRCHNFDLMIAALVQKLPEEEGERWAKRQQDAKRREEEQQKVAHSPVGAAQARLAWKLPPQHPASGGSPHVAVAISNVSPSHGGVQLASNGVNGARTSATAKSEANARVAAECRQGTRRSPRKVGNAAARSEVKRVVVVTCEGCNEAGHKLEECPHRSDSALGDSDDAEGDEDSDDEYEDE